MPSASLSAPCRPTRSLTSRRLGAEVSRNRDHYSVSVMGFGSSFDGRERGRGLAARATVTPIYAGGGNTVLHLVSLRWSSALPVRSSSLRVRNLVHWTSDS
nr:porin [Xanthomonas campestris pv. campestris]